MNIKELEIEYQSAWTNSQHFTTYDMKTAIDICEEGISQQYIVLVNGKRYRSMRSFGKTINLNNWKETMTQLETTTKVINVKRLKNSLNGNPRYEFNFNDVGTVKTPSDAGWVYGFSTDTFLNKNVSIKYHITPTKRYILDSINHA